MFIPPEETVVTVLSHVDSFTVVGQLSSMFSYSEPAALPC